jgi:hypothetical protein
MCRNVLHRRDLTCFPWAAPETDNRELTVLPGGILHDDLETSEMLPGTVSLTISITLDRSNHISERCQIGLTHGAEIQGYVVREGDISCLDVGGSLTECLRGGMTVSAGFKSTPSNCLQRLNGL